MGQGYENGLEGVWNNGLLLAWAEGPSLPKKIPKTGFTNGPNPYSTRTLDLASNSNTTKENLGQTWKENSPSAPENLPWWPGELTWINEKLNLIYALRFCLLFNSCRCCCFIVKDASMSLCARFRIMVTMVDDEEWRIVVDWDEDWRWSSIRAFGKNVNRFQRNFSFLDPSPFFFFSFVMFMFFSEHCCWRNFLGMIIFC